MTWKGHEDERCPPGIKDELKERQQRTEEERQEQTDEVRELEARLRRVEERVYDETMSGQASAQGGQQTDEKMNIGRNGADDGGWGLIVQNCVHGNGGGSRER